MAIRADCDNSCTHSKGINGDAGGAGGVGGFLRIYHHTKKSPPKITAPTPIEVHGNIHSASCSSGGASDGIANEGNGVGVTVERGTICVPTVGRGVGMGVAVGRMFPEPDRAAEVVIVF